MSWLDVGQSVVGNVATGGVLGLVQSLLNRKAADRNAQQTYEYNSKLMEQQNEYNVQAFERERNRQNEIMLTQPSLMKQGLHNAGYSAADPQGTGFSPVAANNMDVPTNPSMQYDMSPVDIAGIYQSVSAARLASSTARKNEIEADYLGKKLGMENEMLELDLKAARDTISERIGSIKSQYYKLTKENKKLDSEIDHVEEMVRNLSLQSDIIEKTKGFQVQKWQNEVALLVKENKIKEVHSKLAEYGIVVGLNDLQSYIAMAKYGSTGEVAQMIGDVIGALSKELPGIISKIIKGLFEGAKQAYNEFFD